MVRITVKPWRERVLECGEQRLRLAAEMLSDCAELEDVLLPLCDDLWVEIHQPIVVVCPKGGHVPMSQEYYVALCGHDRQGRRRVLETTHGTDVRQVCAVAFQLLERHLSLERLEPNAVCDRVAFETCGA